MKENGGGVGVQGEAKGGEYWEEWGEGKQRLGYLITIHK